MHLLGGYMVEIPICPNCGSELVLKTAIKGSHSKAIINLVDNLMGSALENTEQDVPLFRTGGVQW